MENALDREHFTSNPDAVRPTLGHHSLPPRKPRLTLRKSACYVNKFGHPGSPATALN
jgi:hypothetical protein